MQYTKHHFFHGDHHHGDELRPYFFQRTASDALEEALHELLRMRLDDRNRAPRARAPEPKGDVASEVLREQRRTLFRYDAGMRRMFRDDFEAFCAAMDDPEALERTLDERLAALDRERRDASGDGADVRGGTWDASQSPARAWEERQHGDEPHDAGDASVLDDDPIYDAAFRWACRIERWSRSLSAQAASEDRDLERVSVNALLIPAKIAFGFLGSLEDDTTALEVAAIGYRQAAIFSMRVLDSLANCYGRSVGDQEEVHEFLDNGKELLADIESKLAEIEEELRFRGSAAETS